MNGVAERERVESDMDETMAMEVDSPLLLPGEEGERGERGRGTTVDLDNPVDIEKVLAFGRDLQSLFNQVTASKPNDKLKTMLQVCETERRVGENIFIASVNYSFRCALGLLQLASIHRASLQSCWISP